ncbi:MAG TPA: histidine phosphatase family protein [Candidatus Paceibacterota bacterium]
MKKLTIFLFRHGQTTYNRDQQFTGWENPPLTELGIQQARQIAEKLKNEKFQIAYHTSLIRSKDTLKEVLRYHPECTRLIEDDRMIERNYGDLNGMSHETFIKNMGEKLYKLEVEGDLITDLTPEGKLEAEKFLGEQEYNLIHRGFHIPPPRGESFAMVEERVRAFITDLREMMKKEQVNVAISAHGNSIRLFRKIMENASVAETVSWQIPFDSFFEYEMTL